MDKLKEKSIRYVIGYMFFLILGMVGLGHQMWEYLNDKLTLVSPDYWFNPELILTGIFGLFIFRPMGLIEIIELTFKGIVNKITK